jgi:spore germination protein PB
MDITVHQNIVIHSVRVDSITNSSVLQIGSAGIIKSLSNIYNTGGFKESAPQAAQTAASEVSLVPLAPPARLHLL